MSEEDKEDKLADEELAKEFLKEIGLDFGDIVPIKEQETREESLEKIASPLGGKIRELNRLIQDKDAQIQKHLKEIDRLKTVVSQLQSQIEILQQATGSEDSQYKTLQDLMLKVVAENKTLKQQVKELWSVVESIKSL